MHAVVRHYRGASKLIDELAARSADVQEVIRGVPGFVSYHLVKTADGGYSITVCEDRAGTEESSKRAAAYVRENLAALTAGPPEILEGEAVLHFAP